MNISKRIAAVLLMLVLTFTLAMPAYAVNSSNGTINGDINVDDNTTGEYTYSAPTAPMEVDSNIITGSAHRAASPILGMLGINAVSGYGMINGSAPSDLATAQECAALGIWGSANNANPDPYYWNYFYNFYAAENGLEPVLDSVYGGSALTNPASVDGGSGPQACDGSSFEEYGGLSVSMVTRPDVLVGVTASKASENTYEVQIDTINNFAPDSEFYQEGDESYNPQLVNYDITTIKEGIASVKALADAVAEIEAATGKTTRYGDVQTIASDYETYIYGIISYVQEELAAQGLDQKTFAVVLTAIDDGTFLIATGSSTSATSTLRAFEYAEPVATNLADALGLTEADEVEVEGEATNFGATNYTGVIVTKEQLLSADVIITLNNSNLSYSYMAEAVGEEDLLAYDGILITNNPASLYGITMNSVENAVGYAYVIGSMYCDILDINPVELCAYFYQNFEHITDLESLATVVKTNFSDTLLPEGISATLSEDYSNEKIEAMLVKGMDFYTENETAFDAAQYEDCGINEWVPDYELGIGSGAAVEEEPEAPAEEQPAETEAPAAETAEAVQSSGSSTGTIAIVIVVVIVVIAVIAVVISRKKKQ